MKYDSNFLCDLPSGSFNVTLGIRASFCLLMSVNDSLEPWRSPGCELNANWKESNRETDFTMLNVSINQLSIRLTFSSFHLFSSFPISSFLSCITRPSSCSSCLNAVPEGIGLSVTLSAEGYPQSMSVVSCSSDLRSPPLFIQVQATLFSSFLCVFLSDCCSLKGEWTVWFHSLLTFYWFADFVSCIHSKYEHSRFAKPLTLGRYFPRGNFVVIFVEQRWSLDVADVILDYKGTTSATTTTSTSATNGYQILLGVICQTREKLWPYWPSLIRKGLWTELGSFVYSCEEDTRVLSCQYSVTT